MSDLPAADALFIRFLNDSKDFAAARTRFQRLVTDLLAVSHSGISEVAGPGGRDWGIDTFLGSLAGHVVVWQSKFFLVWGEDQKKQIRESFASLMKSAAAEAFTVTAWTLCVPSALTPDARKWWDGWKKRSAKNGLRIELLDGIEIRRLLQQPDAKHVREHYFPESGPPLEEVSLQLVDDLDLLTDTLFVRQLEEAGHVETDAAKGFFFAAEAMARDVAGKADPHEVEALLEAQLEIRGVWEAEFNARSGLASADGRMGGLIDEVSRIVAQLSPHASLNLKPAHRRGLMHRLVEAAKAGWVIHWRTVAKEYDGKSATEILEASGVLESIEGAIE
jgi:hypothetical protein